MKESFRSDMADHERMVGQMPSTRDNDALVAETLTALENKWAADKPATATPADPVDHRQSNAHAAELGYTILREPDTDGDEIVRALNPIEMQAAERMEARVSLLLGKAEGGVLGLPSWRDRVLAAMRTIQWCKEHRQDIRCGYGELFTVLEASNALFGDWKKDPVAPLCLDYGAPSLKAGR